MSPVKAAGSDQDLLVTLEMNMNKTLCFAAKGGSVLSALLAVGHEKGTGGGNSFGAPGAFGTSVGFGFS